MNKPPRFNPQTQTIPALKTPTPCGTAVKIGRNRGAKQMGWYELAGGLAHGMTILDVGAGLCKGLARLQELGAEKVVGYEVDDRLLTINPALVIDKRGLAIFDESSYDCVVAMDVIEHVVDDLPFFNHLRRIARKLLVVSTPNFAISKCRNNAHAREYTIEEFLRFFSPDELWAADADTFTNQTKIYDANNSPTTFDIFKQKSSPTWPTLCGIWRFDKQP